MVERSMGDGDDVVSAGGRCVGDDCRHLVGREVGGVGFVGVLGDGWCVGCVVCGCVEVDGGLLVADGAEESSEVAERRPLLDPAAGAGPVVDEGLVAVECLGEAVGAGEGGDMTDRGDGFEECGAAVAAEGGCPLVVVLCSVGPAGEGVDLAGDIGVEPLQRRGDGDGGEPVVETGRRTQVSVVGVGERSDPEALVGPVGAVCGSGLRGPLLLSGRRG